MYSRRALVIVLLATAVAALTAAEPALAQCAMCRTAVGGSKAAAKLAESLNFAVIVLLIPPVLIFCAIFFAAFRSRRAKDARAAETGGGRLSRLLAQSRRRETHS